MPTTAPLLPLVHLFQVYAHVDYADVQSLVVRLKPNLDADTRMQFRVWSDDQILIGADWGQSIKAALAHADFGLVFLSPAALASGYIKLIEIPALWPKLLTVGLRPVDFRLQVPSPLQALQVFRLKAAIGRHRYHADPDLFYTECNNSRQKDAFAHELYKAIHSRCAL